MTALTKDLKRLIAAAEKNGNTQGRYRQKLHLTPPVGWLNDPNGLCQFQGQYHAFFQYSPFDPEGGSKMWGHCTSQDMLDWEYQGTALYPDQPFDCGGVYSGCALVEDGEMYLYYTGNVKLEDRADYDYINSGREANTVLVTSRDGKNFSPKQLLMKNDAYPSNLTLHVRDPKVWKEGDRYYMLQGARTKEDWGQALLFRSKDRIKWELDSRIETEERFGYMWECPDYFEIDGVKIFSASVQGLAGPEWKDRNVYQSGYFLLQGELHGAYSLSAYRLWDFGFDFYAPQSFETQDGRRILLAWQGMPDCEEYGNRTVKDGWQHCFTFPREVYVKDGLVRQRPIKELEKRRRLAGEGRGLLTDQGRKVFEAEICQIEEERFYALLAGELSLEYKEGRFTMSFSDPGRDSVGCGRTLRYAQIDHLEKVRILADESSVEVFVNDGAYVFSTRYYPEEYKLRIQAPGASIRLYEI